MLRDLASHSMQFITPGHKQVTLLQYEICRGITAVGQREQSQAGLTVKPDFPKKSERGHGMISAQADTRLRFLTVPAFVPLKGLCPHACEPDAPSQKSSIHICPQGTQTQSLRHIGHAPLASARFPARTNVCNHNTPNQPSIGCVCWKYTGISGNQQQQKNQQTYSFYW